MSHRSKALLCAVSCCWVILAQADDVVSKGRWTDYMSDAMPQTFCQDGSYYRSCFSIDEQHCTSVAQQVVRQCLSSLASEIPDQLSMPQDGKKWGEEVGECAGNAYERELAEGYKKDSVKCNDPSAWRE